MGQRDGGQGIRVRRKFHIRLIHHNINAIALALVQDPAHICPVDGGGGGVIGIADHQQINGFVELAKKMGHIQGKIIGLFQRIVQRRAAAQFNFSLVLRVAGADDQRFFRMLDLDKKRDQLRGAVAHDDVGRVGVGIPGNALAKRGVLPIRVGRDHIDVLCQSFLKLRRNAQRVHIGGKTGDIFFFDAVNFFDLFQITAMKMVFMFNDGCLFAHRKTSISFVPLHIVLRGSGKKCYTSTIPKVGSLKSRYACIEVIERLSDLLNMRIKVGRMPHDIRMVSRIARIRSM